MTEREKRLEERLQTVKDSLNKRYETLIIDGEITYKAGDVYFRVFAFSHYNALVAEYAGSIDEVKSGNMEDGDLFYIDDLTDDQILDAIMHEIEE